MKSATTTTSGTRRLIVKIIVGTTCLIMFFAFIGMFTGACGGQMSLLVSDGFRDGAIQKFTKQGILFDTWEGELSTQGIKSQAGTNAIGSTWFFSVKDPVIIKQIQDTKPQQPIRLHYKQPHCMAAWEGSSGYIVWKIEN